MVLRSISLLFVLFLLVTNSTVSFAHNGSLDELGGHFRNSDCVYLLHEPTSLVQSATNIEELIVLIKEYNSNNCKNSLTEDRVDLGEFKLGGSGTSNKKSETSQASTDSSHLELGQRYVATLDRCVDGDTAVLTVNGTSYNTRFLFIDTPEYTTQKEPYGKEASEFTCDFLSEGNISIETDGKELFDKYDRLLAWVFVDNQLHQEEITKLGLVEDFYDYGNYQYEDLVRNAMKQAVDDKLGIYSEQEDTNTKGYVIAGIGVLLAILVLVIRKLF
ncbi:thermonuclease family protein [Bacillus sp. AK128]